MKQEFSFEEFIAPYKEGLLAHGKSRYRFYEYVIPKLIALNRPILVVETGTMWAPIDVDNMGAFTLVIGDLIKNWTGGKLITIDISLKSIEGSKNNTKEVHEVIDYVLSDSVSYLKNMSDEEANNIDLLYLDSYDLFVPDPVPSQIHHLRELLAVYDRLSPTVFIGVDDNFLPHTWVIWNWMDTAGKVIKEEKFDVGNRILGKGTLIDCFLLQEGWKRMDDFLHEDTVHLLVYDRHCDKTRVKKILEDFYTDKSTDKSKREPFDIKAIKLGDADGLGESIILSSVIPGLKVQNEYWEELSKMGYLSSDSVWKEGDGEPLQIDEISRYDWSGGHCTQRLQVATRQAVSKRPKGKIIRQKPSVKGHVFVHLDSTTDWKRNIPNSISLENQEIVKEFFAKNSQYTPIFYKNNMSVIDIVKIMEKCEYFLGIDSGPMHIAATFDIKSIIIINKPESNVYLPKLKECIVPESEWLYPQNVHLNTMGENPLVPRFNMETLTAAFNRKVYPYWKDDFLDLAPIFTQDI